MSEIKVPELGESVVEATVGQWLKREGESVSAGEPVVELETDKVNLEVTAADNGVLVSIAKQPGETVGVGAVLGVVDEAGGVGPTAPSAPPAASEDGPAARATPGVRRLAKEQGIDIEQVTGSGPGGRVVRHDIETRPASPPLPAVEEAPAVAEQRREERVRMSARRQTIARRLVEAQRTAAMLTTFNEVDMSAILEVRSRRRDVFKERHGVGLGFMSFFTKAVVGALKAFPRLNAQIDQDTMVLKHYYDIGIAVATEGGLVVPVVRNADQLGFAEIERQIQVLAEKARQNRLGLSELAGGTFTITNGGVFGSLLSTPILNTPQVGILGMHKIQERPVAVNGQVVVRPMMYVALSYDHRIVDGSEAVRFLVRVKELLEDPLALLLDG